MVGWSSSILVTSSLNVTLDLVDLLEPLRLKELLDKEDEVRESLFALRNNRLYRLSIVELLESELGLIYKSKLEPSPILIGSLAFLVLFFLLLMGSP